VAARVALVTGGLSGIGLASAVALAQAGHRVAVCSRRGDGPEAEAARAALGPGALIGAADIADRAGLARFVDRVRGELGAPTILVNAAGIYRESYLDGDDADAAWADQIAVNLDGAWNATRAVWPDMIAAGWGRIVLIASTAGSVGAAGYAGYCASKAGVIGLAKAAAIEGAPHGISAITISPTWVETPMMDAAIRRHAAAGNTTEAEARAAIAASNPQGRIVQPGEIGALVAFHCSDLAPGLTNEDIQINAGAHW
jgi:NAD(P)-dependent dehydrogenase (short-subunit alcohol dehydrogenase family)